MIKVCLALFITCAAIFLGPFLADSQGFVHIATNDHIIEFSIITGLLLAIIAFVIFYFIVNLILNVLHLPQGASSLLKRHADKKSQSLQNNALIAYEEGDFKRALALFNKTCKAKDSNFTFTKFIAANSAFELEDYAKAREILDDIAKNDKQAALAVAIVRAKMNLRLGNIEAALDTLKPIKLKDSTFFSKLSYQNLKHNNDYEGLAKMAPQLLDDKVITEDEATQIYAQDFANQLNEITSATEAIALKKALPKKVRYKLLINSYLMKKLDDLNAIAPLNKLTRDLINHNDDASTLFHAISKLNSPLPEIRMMVEDRVNKHSANDEEKNALLKALSQLENNDNLHDNAYEHLLAAQKIRNDADVCERLGVTLSKMHLYEKASEYFNLALKKSAN